MDQNGLGKGLKWTNPFQPLFRIFAFKESHWTQEMEILMKEKAHIHCSNNNTYNKSMNLKQRIKEYNTGINPKVIGHNEKLRQLLYVSTLTNEKKAKVLLIGDINWYPGCHQWYLKFHKDVYDDTIADIINHRLWEIPLNMFGSFEELYDSFYKWLLRPYINQLTIYDVALRLVLARDETRLLPHDYVYIHAKPRGVYQYLYHTRMVLYKPNGWNTKVPIEVFRKKFSDLKPFESYLIEDLLCYIAKKDFRKRK